MPFLKPGLGNHDFFLKPGDSLCEHRLSHALRLKSRWRSQMQHLISCDAAGGATSPSSSDYNSQIIIIIIRKLVPVVATEMILNCSYNTAFMVWEGGYGKTGVTENNWKQNGYIFVIKSSVTKGTNHNFSSEVIFSKYGFHFSFWKSLCP